MGAFQDLGATDFDVQNAFAKHLSDSILRLLRPRVGKHHPNQGWDIILRTHGAIFEALLKPKSAIHTAELRGSNPFDYLVSLLRRHDDLVKKPADWMP